MSLISAATSTPVGPPPQTTKLSKTLAFFGCGCGEGSHFKVVKDVRSDLTRVADGLQVEAVFETRDTVRVGDTTRSDDETVVGDVDALADGFLAFTNDLASTAESFAIQSSPLMTLTSSKRSLPPW